MRPGRAAAILLLAAAGALFVTGAPRFVTGTTSAPARESPGASAPRAAAASLPDTRDTRGALIPDRAAAKHGSRAQLAALTSLTAASTPDDGLAALAIADGDVAVREEALMQLGERGGLIAIGTLEQGLQDPQARVRKTAIQALARLRGSTVEHTLAMALAERDPELRLEAVDALGALGPPSVRRHLPVMLFDPDPRVREAAGEWLAECSAR